MRRRFNRFNNLTSRERAQLEHGEGLKKRSEILAFGVAEYLKDCYRAKDARVSLEVLAEVVKLREDAEAIEARLDSKRIKLRRRRVLIRPKKKAKE